MPFSFGVPSLFRLNSKGDKQHTRGNLCRNVLFIEKSILKLLEKGQNPKTSKIDKEKCIREQYN